MVLHIFTKYGKRLFPVFLFLMTVSLVFPAFGHAGDDSGNYVDQLVQVAREKKLGENRYWRILLHYGSTLAGARSLVSDPAFFLTKEGMTDPQIELEAMIRTYFDPAVKDSAPSVCRYIARYVWLKEMLSPDETKIPPIGCPEAENLQPRSAILVFPTYYLNNPASMFGHTFLNIETGYATAPLTNSVNYAADPGNANAIQYTIHGILGGFRGYFTVLPYYKKIREYSDIDQRDIWEYRLNLTETELKRMALHIRELQGIGSDYYFFTRNCSYHLLFLLEAARPSLHLTDRFGLWVVPIDTVKLMKQEGVVESAAFRPSNGTKIRQKMKLLPPELVDMAYAIGNGRIDPGTIDELPLPGDRKIVMSDLVGEYLTHRLVKQEMSQKEYQDVAFPNLRLRSRLGTFDESRYAVDVPPDPAMGHDTSRVYAAMGSRHHSLYQEIGINPSFTDLLNTDYTRREGIEIQFLDTRLRYEEEDRRLRLERCDVLDVVSLFPRDRFFKPLSWTFNTGFRRETLADGRRALMFRINAGTGWSWSIPFAGLCYVLPQTEFRGAGDLKRNSVLGAGVSAGVMRDIFSWWKTHLSTGFLYFEPEDDYHEFTVSLDQNFTLDRNTRLQLGISREDVSGSDAYDVSLALQRYF
jgi:hypothetical protein